MLRSSDCLPFVASLVREFSSSHKMLTLGLLLVFRLDKWYAVSVLGWELEENGLHDYHFHPCGNHVLPVYPRDYKLLNRRRRVLPWLP